MTSKAIKVFLSYAHQDEDLLLELVKHLQGLQRPGYIDLWHNRAISAGAERKKEIDKQLNTAQIILLLISPDFMASDYCYGKEMKLAMERHKQGKARVIPVKLRPVDCRDAPFAKLEALPTGDKPVMVSDGHSVDEAFFDVAKGIRKAIEDRAEREQERLSTLPSSFLTEDTRLPPIPEKPSSQLFSTAQENTKDREVHESFDVTESLEYIEYVCPYCAERCYLGDCAIASRINPGTILQPTPQRSQQHQARLHPDPLISSRYIREMACRVCSNCTNLLPPNIERVDSMRIAVIGESFSGKSHYIASLIHELQEGHMQEAVQFASIDDELAMHYFREYYGPLFLDKCVIERTPPGRLYRRDELGTGPIRKPFMYDVVIASTSSHLTKRVNLMIYDASGEDYTNPESMIKLCRYVFSANAIILLIDPLMIPGIAARLPPHFLANNPYAGSPRISTSILNTIIQVFGSFNYQDESERNLFSIPLAITLSKSDLLKYLFPGDHDLPLNDSPRFLMHPSYDTDFDMADVDIVDKEVKELLKISEQRMLLRTVQAFSHVKFFATSATGYPADHMQYPDIKPLRCVDPLRWILYQLDIIGVHQPGVIAQPKLALHPRFWSWLFGKR